MSVIAIRIISDSTCDLSREDRERLQVEVIPLTVHFGEKAYLDGVDISNEQFYDYLEQSENLPTTSQVTPQVFADAFKKHLDAGDEVVGIFISGGMSGTYQSACIAKDMLESDRLHIVDSRSATMGLALILSEAAKHRDAGFSAAQVAEYAAALSQKIRFLVALNTLKYVRKGGRVSATSAVIGELLDIKPIVAIIDGTVQTIGKARGMQAAIKEMLQKALADLPDLKHGVAFAHACAPELAQKAIACMKEPLKLTDWLICSAGSVIGTYAGRGVVGFAYIAK